MLKGRVPIVRPLKLLAAVAALLVAGSCAGKKSPLDSFAESQQKKMHDKSAYVQADFDFWAAAYEPTRDDIEGLRAAWVEHGEAFPESKALGTIEKELRTSNQRTVLVAMFMTEFDKADLNDKSLGWAVHPVPTKIVELSEADVVLRRLMPVRNQWARYYLLRYAPGTLESAQSFVVSNATSRVELHRGALQAN